jgi:arginyl-tRNA synthetase
MKSRLRTLLGDAVKACVSQDLLEIEAVPLIEIDITKDAAFGDYASNIAMVLASRVKGKLPPRKVAEVIRDHIRDNDGVLERVDIAGPGFMNFFIREGVWSTLLSEVDNLGDCYGSSDYGEGKKIHIEFVSANPTGPLHIGHARGAVVGDVIANIQEAAGFSVFREYYINDAGNQMNNLGKSVLYRYLEFLGDDVEFPESCYQGDYIKEIAREIIDKHGGIYRSKDQEEALRIFTD